MKKIFAVIIFIVFLVLLLSACGQELKKSSTADNAQQKSYLTEQSSQNPKTEPTKKPSISEESSRNPISKPIILSNREIEQYLKSKKSVILNNLGMENEAGTTSILESHMNFPCVFVKDLGLTFIFSTNKDDITPSYISVHAETNVNNVNIKSAKPGMTFKDIMSKAGNSEVQKTWISNENNIAYVVDYKLDGLVYSFVSYDESGTASELYVSLE